MSVSKVDQRSAIQIKTEALVVIALAACRARHGDVMPGPNRFLRPQMMTAPMPVRVG